MKANMSSENRKIFNGNTRLSIVGTKNYGMFSEEGNKMNDLKLLYSKIDQIIVKHQVHCIKEGCCDCCLKSSGLQPTISPREIAPIAKYISTKGMSRYNQAKDRCPFLSDQGKCLIYEVRPVSCRAFYCKIEDEPKQEIFFLLKRYFELNPDEAKHMNFISNICF